ncbi:hypothetical protein Cgig2_004617 [Carnegiea gigantea]|uniref:Aminotransferase-like plant mobile domain-containing protein n=1 Tax=Carnegiea gigantea TaxID=171969 RepID=A0A9Q1JZB6_9CARY|nr:hypothetical protein Cgig2_004617 [Carnegiea gigantea]
MNYFKGKGGELEHVALLVLWLSRCVFSTHSLFRINQDVFDIAIRLAKGIKVALAPAVLALIYRDFRLVQLWAWESFPCLSPKPNSLMLGEPRLARWHGLRKIEIEGLRDELEAAGDHFLWKPYALNLKNWDFPKFYSDKERWVLVNSEVDDELLSFAICLRASELVAVDCLEQYCPNRVAMQFGMDQDIPNSLPRSLAWSSYNKPLDGWRFHLPHRLVEGDVTYQYSNWWKEAFPSDDHMLIVYKRKPSPRKVESLYHILTRSLRSDEDNRALVCFPPNEEPLALNYVGGRTELMLIENLPSFETMQEIETRCDGDGSSVAENEALIGKEPQVVEMKRPHGDDNRAPVCIPPNKEAMALDFVGSRTELMLVKKSPSCETAQAVETLCDQNGSSMAENEALICKDPQAAEMKHLGDDGNKAPVSNKGAAALEVVEPRTELKLIEKPLLVKQSRKMKSFMIKIGHQRLRMKLMLAKMPRLMK